MTPPPNDPGSAATATPGFVATVTGGASGLLAMLGIAVARGRTQGQVLEKVATLEAHTVKTDAKIDKIGDRMDAHHLEVMRQIGHAADAIRLVSGDVIALMADSKGFRRDIDRIDQERTG